MNMTPRKKRLRSGFTTGACAAAAAKAAALLLISGQTPQEVSIPFPDGQSRSFSIKRSELRKGSDYRKASASVIKDAGDDPDVTNGAEIFTEVAISLSTQPADLLLANKTGIIFQAGEGVGTVTKPGLAIPVGQPAINPMPRQMIADALSKISWPDDSINQGEQLIIKISVPNGCKLAEKTLNYRLGIVGGLSILGTTGIVTPISAEAWTATIEASMAVARETGCREIVLSTGRTSEKATQKLLDLPIESYAMMGDYLGFSLQAAHNFGFQKIHLAGMWAKILKAAMRIPQTHVRNGALEIKEAASFIAALAQEQKLQQQLSDANTAREIYERLRVDGRHDLIRLVCETAKDFAQTTSKLPVTLYLVESPGKVVAHV